MCNQQLELHTYCHNTSKKGTRDKIKRRSMLKDKWERRWNRGESPPFIIRTSRAKRDCRSWRRRNLLFLLLLLVIIIIIIKITDYRLLCNKGVTILCNERESGISHEFFNRERRAYNRTDAWMWAKNIVYNI